MILGIGNDIIEIERIRANIEEYGSRFLNRIFTPQEQDYCLKHKDPAPHFAGRFAAKEAAVKALGTGFREGLHWLDVEIIPDSKGKPILQTSSLLNILFNNPHLLISISHCRTYATAVAIWTKN